MSILAASTNTTIQGCNLTAISITINTSGQNDLISLLLSHSATGVLLDAIKQPHSVEFDEAILLEMKNFVKEGDHYSPSAIYCLHGPAGIGNLSALAHSLALSLRHEGDHAASFFFSRSAPERSNWDQFIVTLAYQLAVNIPGLRSFIWSAIQHNPAILRSSNGEKVQTLVIEPVNQWNLHHSWHFQQSVQRDANYKTHPRLILIDGLDHCDDSNIQQDLVLCIGHAARQLSVPFRFVFFSRPGSHILTMLKFNPVFQDPSCINILVKELQSQPHEENDTEGCSSKSCHDQQDIHAKSASPYGNSTMQYHEFGGPYFVTDPTAELFPSPAVQSSFSVWYHTLPEDLYPMDELPESRWTPDMVSYAYPSTFVSFQVISEATRNYVLNAVKIQHLLGNRNSLPNMIWKAINAHNDSRDAVALLAKAYYGRQRDTSYSVLMDTDTVERVRNIGLSISSRARFSADDAMAALHIISLYLFDGGRGRWDYFLYLASKYVQDVLEAPLYRGNYPLALEHATPKDQFIIKTTIWFDVLASITTQEPPKLIEYIRELFKPNRSWVGRPYTYSMLDPIGCENDVVWALAEISCLSYWKRRHEITGDLSIRQLVVKVSEIDQHLAAASRPFPPQPDEDSWRRFLASEIFRTAAKLLLTAVESGDHPLVEEVRTCSDECFNAIIRYPSAETPTARSAIMRSTVFGVFICGALTDDPMKQHVLRTHLMQNSGQEGVGSVSVVLGVLEKVWHTNSRRVAQGRNIVVQWRQYLRHYKVILV